MYGLDVGMLRLDQLNPSIDKNGLDKYSPVYLWHASYTFPDNWYSYMRTFEDFTGKVQITGSLFYQDAMQGDIAIDNFSIVNGTCPDDLG
jgi:hypothetical protein